MMPLIEASKLLLVCCDVQVYISDDWSNCCSSSSRWTIAPSMRGITVGLVLAVDRNFNHLHYQGVKYNRPEVEFRTIQPLRDYNFSEALPYMSAKIHHLPL